MSNIQKNNKWNKSKEQFINTPIWFIKKYSNKNGALYLTPFEQQLFCLINGLSQKNGCFANDRYFSEVFNVTIKHVNNSIQNLVLKGLLSIEHNNTKRIIHPVTIDSLKECIHTRKFNDFYIISNETNTIKIKINEIMKHQKELEMIFAKAS